jgi:hypothetical protein
MEKEYIVTSDGEATTESTFLLLAGPTAKIEVVKWMKSV